MNNEQYINTINKVISDIDLVKDCLTSQQIQSFDKEIGQKILALKDCIDALLKVKEKYLSSNKDM